MSRQKQARATKTADAAHAENMERIAWITKRIAFESWFAERIPFREEYSESARESMIAGTKKEIARLQSELERRKMAQSGSWATSG